MDGWETTYILGPGLVSGAFFCQFQGGFKKNRQEKDNSGNSDQLGVICFVVGSFGDTIPPKLMILFSFLGSANRSLRSAYSERFRHV